MAKRRNPTPQKKRPTPSALPAAAMPTLPENQSVTKQHTKKIAERFIDSAIDTALEHFWLGVAATMIALTTAIWLYIKSGRALWLYPTLKYAITFIGGWL